MIIHSFSARKVFNSRKEFTIEVTVKTSHGKYIATAPSGASRGKNEVLPHSLGGIDSSIKLLNSIHQLKNFQIENFEDFSDIEEIFFRYDKTPYLEKIGGNAIIAFEFAVLKALSKGKIWQFLNPNAASLPVPLGNCMGGGAHIHGKGMDVQEFLLMPQAKSFQERAGLNSKVYNLLGKKLRCTMKTDEGGWAPCIPDTRAFEVLKSTLGECQSKKNTIQMGIDLAASQLFKKDRYQYTFFSENEKTKVFSEDEQIEWIKSLVKDFGLKYVEDPFHEESFEYYKRLKPLFKKTIICGDDLVCTDIRRLKKASVNGVIVKPNQIGSLLKTKEIVDYAQKHNIKTVISHRSGETMDATISHLAVAWNIPYIKCGIVGKEREAKINELVKIEKEILSR